MHRPPETQSSPEAMSTQSSHTWRAESSVCRVNSLQQVGCQSWLLVSPSWPRQPADHYISDPVWSILLDQITIWTQGVTRHIPSQNGRDLGRPSRRGWDHRWRLRAWQRWRGARPEPESTHGQSKRNRAGVQFRQVHNQTTWDQFLRQHLLQRWHQAWPGQGSWHPEHACSTGQRGSAEIPRYDDIPCNIHSQLQWRITATQGPPEEERPIWDVGRPPPLLPETQNSNFSKVVCQILWPNKTHHAGGRQFNERSWRSNSAGRSTCCIRIQSAQLSTKQLPKHWPGDARRCVRHQSLSHVPVRTPFSNDNWSQATRNDCQEAPPQSTNQATEDAPENTGIWLHHRVSTRKDDDPGRHCQGCRIQRTRAQSSWISGLMVLRWRQRKVIAVT